MITFKCNFWLPYGVPKLLNGVPKIEFKCNHVLVIYFSICCCSTNVTDLPIVNTLPSAVMVPSQRRPSNDSSLGRMLDGMAKADDYSFINICESIFPDPSSFQTMGNPLG
jgi:hypothetical protein